MRRLSSNIRSSGRFTVHIAFRSDMGGKMDWQKCDVLVVGCGPAGSGAGRAAAESGARTIVIDRKREIGTPVQCGEVIGRSVLAMSDIKIPRYALHRRPDLPLSVDDDGPR